jgi:hypothetical protein
VVLPTAIAEHSSYHPSPNTDTAEFSRYLTPIASQHSDPTELSALAKPEELAQTSGQQACAS